MLILAANASGFGASNEAKFKPFVSIFSDHGEGVDMNQLFKGIDLDLRQPGNPAACGILHL